MPDFGSAFGSTFSSSALQNSRVRVVSIDGCERLGQLYEFRVRFEYGAEALTEAQIDKLLLAPCAIAIGNGDPVNGIAREVGLVATREGGTSIYDVVVVPTMWLLTISRVSRLYQAMSVKDMASEMLGRYGLTGHADLRMAPGDPRDFCIQYHESDWDFLQRWFEHEGCFYWFEHSASGEKLVVADANSQTTPISGDTAMQYLDGLRMVRTKESVFDWRGSYRRIPAGVVLKDYNDEKPLLPIVGSADVDRQRGFGVVFEYGDDFDTPAAGNVLAKKRAERFLSERLTMTGVTDSPRFHVGHWFELQGHFDDEQNRKYLITAIDHRVRDDVGRAAEEGAGAYRATFEAIPFSTQYRPARRTPWPSIHGLMHGHIDSDSAGKYSTLDDKGRYHVRFPFDSTGKTGEKSSIWIRMAQHYAGSGYGSHFPLHKGTEVLLAFYDGDPDRPIIVGTVPNPVTAAPSTGANATQSVVKTASGLQITMDDSVSG